VNKWIIIIIKEQKLPPELKDLVGSSLGVRTLDLWKDQDLQTKTFLVQRSQCSTWSPDYMVTGPCNKYKRNTRHEKMFWEKKKEINGNDQNKKFSHSLIHLLHIKWLIRMTLMILNTCTSIKIDIYAYIEML
jgi:hypothetical protein